ncbi:hypothetical protein SASPL_114833 [Salvia splendens]|uniref:Uncharacterized protein n=1 Tax=Salvia splendens TaxID=180675 RepID=A0A8X8Y6E7_SALSN|nr:hypothetical protein SASPL_114833 [Salvia splendens]
MCSPASACGTKSSSLFGVLGLPSPPASNPQNMAGYGNTQRIRFLVEEIDAYGHLFSFPSVGLLKLHDDILTCGYEDVQIMWEMLKKTETEVMSDHRKRKRRNFSWRAAPSV